MQRLWRVVVTVAVAFVGPSCSGGGAPTTPTAATLTLTCATTSLSGVGQQTPCTAIVTLSSGQTQDATATASWTSSNTSVATVSGTGLVTAVGVGSTDITARAQTVSATRTILVSSPPPTAAMSVRFPATSSYGLVVALQDISAVTFDVSNCTGTGLSYRLAYGDGAVDTNPMRFPDKGTWFEHAYHGLGTFAVQLTVTDSQSRQASTSTFVTVKSLTGTWGNVIKNPSSGVTESRLLSLIQGTASGSEASLTGSYTHPAGNSEPLTGSVEGDGTIRTLALNSGTISFSGNMLDLNGVTPDASALKLVVKGGSANGLTLTFTRQ